MRCWAAYLIKQLQDCIRKLTMQKKKKRKCSRRRRGRRNKDAAEEEDEEEDEKGDNGSLPWLYSRSSSKSFLYSTLLPG